MYSKETSQKAILIKNIQKKKKTWPYSVYELEKLTSSSYHWKPYFIKYCKLSAISILKDHCFQCAIKKPRIVHLLYTFIVFTGLFFLIKCLGLPIKKMTLCSVSFLFTHKFRLIHVFLLCLLELVYYKVTIIILPPVRLVLSYRCHEEFTN